MGAKKPVNLNEGLKAKQTQLDTLRKALLEQVMANKAKAELEAILKKDNEALGDSQPHINYYAPNAGEQLKHKHQILELNIQKLNYLEATLLWINQQQNALEAFLKIQDPTDEAQKSTLASINGVIKSADAALKLLNDKSDPEKIIKLPGINTILEKIALQTELKNIENELKSINKQIENDNQASKKDKLKQKDRAEIETKQRELDSRKETIKDEVSRFKDETDKLIDFKTIEIEKRSLEQKLAKHLKIEKQIPNGMMDVKKTLFILGERRIAERKIEETQKKLALTSLNEKEKENAKKEISALEQKVASLQFSTSEEEEKKIIAMLDDLQLLMSISIKEYRDLASNGGEINALLHKTTAFYWENLYLYRETLTAVNEYFKNAKNLTENGQFVKECVSTAFDALPKKEVINSALKKVDAVDIDLEKRQKLYEEKGSQSQTSTNFYKGTGIRFVEGLLKQKSNTDEAECEKQDLFHIPYNAGMYVLDHPAGTDLADTLGNCFGEAHMFLQRINGKKPTVNTMCPEPDLVNFQLDQTRKIAGCKEKVRLAHVVKPFNEQAEDKGKVHWDDIKKDILKEATSTKNGDVCVVHFGGATVEGHTGAVGHAIGLIKMKKPDPFKYVLYDYSLGALGFSTDKQLQGYFDLLLEYYVPFYKVNVEKLAELSDEGYQFIKNIKPVEAADLSKKCERDNWSNTRLMLFEKYGIQAPEGILTLLKQAKNLSETQQASLYEKALAHKKLPLNELLTIAIATSNLNFFNRILKNNDFSSKNRTQALNLVIQKQPTDQALLNRVLQDPLLTQNDRSDALKLAVQQKDRGTPEIVKTILMTFDDLSEVTHNDLKEALLTSDPAFIDELLKAKKITVERVAKRCGLASNLAIMKVCYNYDPQQALEHAGKKIKDDLAKKELQADVAAEVIAKSEKESHSSQSVTPEGVSPLETAPDEKQDEVESLSDADRTPSISPQHAPLQETEIPREPDNIPAATEKEKIEEERARLAHEEAAREELERKTQEEEAAEEEKIAARIAENARQQIQLQEQESPIRTAMEQNETINIENLQKRMKDEAEEITRLAAETKQMDALNMDESTARATLAAEGEEKRENVASLQQTPPPLIEPLSPVIPYTPEEKVVIEQPPIIQKQPKPTSVTLANQQEPSPFDIYNVFKIERTDDLSEVLKAYRKLTLLYHPDKDRLGRYTKQWNELQSALEIVNSPEKLTNYYARTQANLIEAPAEVLQIKNRPEETAVNVDVMKRKDEPMGRLAVSQTEKGISVQKAREEAKRKEAAGASSSPPTQPELDHSPTFKLLKEQLSSIKRTVTQNLTTHKADLAKHANDIIKRIPFRLSKEREIIKETMLSNKIETLLAQEDDKTITEEFNSLCRIAGKERNRAWELLGKFKPSLGYSTNTTSAKLLINTLKTNDEACKLLGIEKDTLKEREEALKARMKEAFKSSTDIPDFSPNTKNPG